MSRSRTSSKQHSKTTQQHSSPTRGGPGASADRRPKPALEPAPDRDPFGTYERRLTVIAKRIHMDLNDLMDIWDEMAATRTYLGLYSLEDANELAFQDVEKMFAPQAEMFDEEAA